MKTVQLDQLKQQFPLIQTLQDYQETFGLILTVIL